MTPEKKAFRKHCGKRENAGEQHFLPFPQYFLKDRNNHVKHITFVVCKWFHLGPDQNLSFGRIQKFLNVSHPIPGGTVGSVQDMRLRVAGSNPKLCQFFFRGLVIATGAISSHQ